MECVIIPSSIFNEQLNQLFTVTHQIYMGLCISVILKLRYSEDLYHYFCFSDFWHISVLIFGGGCTIDMTAKPVLHSICITHNVMTPDASL